MSKNKINNFEVYISKERTVINNITFSLMETSFDSFILVNCKESNYYSEQVKVSKNICFKQTVDVLYHKHLEKILIAREYIKMIETKKAFEKKNPWLKIKH
jgi:hypothetical protein